MSGSVNTESLIITGVLLMVVLLVVAVYVKNIVGSYI